MRVTFGAGYKRCIKNFTPLRIVPKHTDGNEERFFIFDGKNNAVGSFCFSPEGCLHSLELAQSIQRRKTAADAILSIRNFIIEKAKERNLDFVFCRSYKNNPNNVQRLYTHLGLPVVKETTGRLTHSAMIPMDDEIVFDFMKEIQNIASINKLS